MFSFKVHTHTRLEEILLFSGKLRFRVNLESMSIHMNHDACCDNLLSIHFQNLFVRGFEISMEYYSSPSLGCFFGACIVGLLSNYAARFMKEPATIFIIPGILCLVPGSAIFNTMAALLRDDFGDAAEIGMQTLCMAGAIALGLLVIGAALRIFYALIRKTVTLKDKF